MSPARGRLFLDRAVLLTCSRGFECCVERCEFPIATYTYFTQLCASSSLSYSVTPTSSPTKDRILYWILCISVMHHYAHSAFLLVVIITGMKCKSL